MAKAEIPPQNANRVVQTPDTRSTLLLCPRRARKAASMSPDQVVKHNFKLSDTRRPSCVLVTGNGTFVKEAGIVIVHFGKTT